MMRLRIALLGLLLVGPSGCADKPPSMPKLTAAEEAAIAEIEAVGGRFRLEAGEVTGMELSNSKITDSDLATFEILTNVETLALSNTQITDAGLQHLGELTKLRVLHLMQTQVTDAGLESLKGLTNLQSLYLEGTQVTDTGLEHLKGLARLRRLWLFGGRYRLEGGEVIAVNFGTTQITDSGLERHVKSLANLRSLELRSREVTDGGLQHLAGLTQLKRLYVKDAQITDGGLECLRGLSQLEYLGLDTTSVTAAKVKEMSHALPSLRMSHRLVTPRPVAEMSDPNLDEGLDSVIGILQRFGGHYALLAGEVIELDLSQAPVTDAGLQQIGTLNSLRNLSLNGTRISDAGLKHLKGNTSLRTLDLTNTQVTNDGVSELEAALPRLRAFR